MSRFLILISGRDITNLFHSYHPFTHAHEAILPKFQIGVLTDQELNHFTPDTGFYRELRDKVGDYFKKNNKYSKDPTPGLKYLAALMLAVVLTYFQVYYFTNSPFWLRLVSAVIFGCCQGLVLLQMMHDASHSSIGPNELWWKVIGRFTMDWIAGASMTSWHHQHVLGHHIYTNIMGVDPDLPGVSSGDLRYLVHRQIWQQLYKYQHIYMPILYGLLAIKFRIQDFTDTFAKSTNGVIRVNPVGVSGWTYLIAAKIWHIILRFVIPRYLGAQWSTIIGFYFLMEIVTGYYLAFNFQVSHVSTEAFFPLDAKFEAEIGQEWAVIQVVTGVDYDHKSPLMAFLCGHLNYQIEHHLFPSVSQYHYPAIAPIVKDTCKKWNVPYNYVPTFFGAVKMHIKYMYLMGNRPAESHGIKLNLKR